MRRRMQSECKHKCLNRLEVLPMTDIGQTRKRHITVQYMLETSYHRLRSYRHRRRRRCLVRSLHLNTVCGSRGTAGCIIILLIYQQLLLLIFFLIIFVYLLCAHTDILVHVHRRLTPLRTRTVIWLWYGSDEEDESEQEEKS